MSQPCWRCSNHWLQRLLRPAGVTAVEQAKLAEREQQIGHWAAQGKSNREIAAILGIRKNTGKTHVANLLRKQGLTSRADLKQQDWPQNCNTVQPKALAI